MDGGAVLGCGRSPSLPPPHPLSDVASSPSAIDPTQRCDIGGDYHVAPLARIAHSSGARRGAQTRRSPAQPRL